MNILRALLFLVMFLPFGINAQVVLNRSHHHFGVLNSKSERFTDFVLTNKTGKKFFVLRIESERDISTIISNKTVLPDSSVTIRVQYNPKETGRFSREIGVYISSSNDPLMLTLSGEVKDLPSMTDLACPDFNRVVDAGRVPQFELEIKVIDRMTGEPIEDAFVKMIYQGLPKYQFETNSSGEIVKRVDLGYYYFVTKAEGYKGKEFDAYVNIRNNRVLIELEPVITKPVDEPPLDSLFYVVRSIPILDPGKPRHEDLEPLLTTEDQLLSPRDTVRFSSTETLTKEKEMKEEFRYNNLVFLIDVSGSMMTDGKMDLFKASMIELCNQLGPQDKVSVVVYSSNARVVLENVAGNDKDLIISRIQNMEGSGYTAGSEGMKLAYEIANRHYMSDGNNMVIMATDGAFNMYTNDVGPMVKRNLKKGITTSVLAIKNTERDSKSMQSIAEMGSGKYIPINDLDQALSRLSEEVRNASRRE